MKRFLSLMVLYILFHSCTKQVGIPGPAGPRGSAGPAGMNNPDTGTIKGRAFLYDEFSFRRSTQSGILVTLISGTVQVADTTDQNGEYRFYGMPTGTYDLTYEFAGSGTMKRFGVSHFGGGTIPTLLEEVDLIQIPVKTAIDSMAIIFSNYAFTTLSLSLQTSSLQYIQYYQNFLLFAGKDNAVGPTHYVKKYGEQFNPDGSGNYVFVISKSDLASFFNPGDTLYITACTYNRYLHPNSSPLYLFDDLTNESYIDPANGFIVFPSARFSPVILKTAF